MLSKCILILFLSAVFAEEQSYICATKSCDDVKCDTKQTVCDIQNSTHHGEWFPSLDQCNCCKICIKYLPEGDVCTKGSYDTYLVKEMCGPGLTCIDNICQTMETECFKKQKDYDLRRNDGNAGSMEIMETCDEDGFYQTYKCIPGQTCHCVYKNRTRIFGEIPFTDIPQFKLKCGCSRKYIEAVEVIGKDLAPNEHFRCLPNGDYDSLQCIGDSCFCVLNEDGAPIGDTVVNLKELKKDALPCFDEKIHTQGEYYKKCEKEYLAILDEINEYQKNDFSMVFSYRFPKCDPDGSYGPVQENSTHKYCVDVNGGVLLSLEKTSENEKLVKDMNCKCIRSKALVNSREKPECDLNGNYSPIQCRRGFCRCVDDDGNQICPNADVCPDSDTKDITCTA